MNTLTHHRALFLSGRLPCCGAALLMLLAAPAHGQAKVSPKPEAPKTVRVVLGPLNLDGLAGKTACVYHLSTW